MHDNRPVAAAKMTATGQIEDGIVTLEPGKPVNVAFLLTDDQAPDLRIQVLDADTDAVLYTSPKDIPVRLGVWSSAPGTRCCRPDAGGEDSPPEGSGTRGDRK